MWMLRPQFVELFLDFEDDVGDFVGGAVAVAVYAADIDVGEVVVGAALKCCDSDFGRCGLVVELDPEAGDEFLGLVAGQCAFCDALLVEGEEVLVDVSGVHGVPAVELCDGAQVHEPVHLNGFPEVAGCVGGHMMTNVCYFQQLRLAEWVVGLGGHLFCQFGMSLGEEDGGIAGDGHGLEFLLLVGGFGVVDVVELTDALLDACFHVEEAFVVHLAVHGGVPGGALFHELGEDACVVGFFPLLADVVEDALALGLAGPVGDDFALVGVDVFL